MTCHPSQPHPRPILAELDQLIERLRYTDPQDEIWGSLENRMAALRDLQAEKAQALEQARQQSAVRQRVLSQLKFLGEQHVARLRFHELDWLPAWTAVDDLVLDTSALELLAEDLSELERLLGEHERRLGELPPTARQHRELRNYLEQVEERLGQVYIRVARVLNAAVKPAPEPEPPAPEPEPPAPEPEPPAPEPEPPAPEPEPPAPEPEPPAPQPEPPAPEPEPPAPEPEPPAPWVGPSSPVAALFWSLVAQGDFASAYWLSFAHAHAGTELLAPAWILRACFLASQVRSYGDEAATELSSLLFQHPAPMADLILDAPHLGRKGAMLLVAIAALRPALVSAETGAPAWLQETLEALPELRPIQEAILGLATAGVSLDAAALRSTHEAARQEQQVGELAARAKEWLATQQKSHFKYNPATTVIHRLAADVTELGQAAAAVAANQRERLPLVRKVLRSQLSSRSAMDDAIAAENRHTSRGPTVYRITGPILETLVTRLGELRDIMKAWVEAVDAAIVVPPDWRENQIAIFHSRFQQAWTPLAHGMPRDPDDSPSIASLKAAVWEVLRNLERQVVASSDSAPELSPGQGDWRRRLRAPLLLLDDVPIGDDGELPATIPGESAIQLAGCIERQEAWGAVVVRLTGQGDFLAARLALEEVTDSAQRAELLQVIQETHGAASESFRRSLNAMRRELEQATIDHVLTESDRAQFEGVLLSLEAQGRASAPRFGVLGAELARQQGHLNQWRQGRANHLRETIAALGGVLAQAEGDVLAQAAQYRDRAAEALDRGDLALADEYATLVEEVMRSGYPISAEPERAGLQELDRFVRAMPELMKSLEDDDRHARKKVRDKLVEGENVAGLDMTHVPGARYREIAGALDAFRGLKGTRGKFDPKYEWMAAVTHILSYLGFRSPEPLRKAVKQSYWHYTAEMSDTGLSPLPHFGSYRNGKYDILLVWDRPSVDSLGQIVQEAGLTAKCPIVLFMGRMSMRQREDWGSYCIRHQLTVLLVDELLLYYLATIRNNRLPVCVACSLPWCFSNPYTPFGAGNVPPEVFKGRQGVLRELTDLNGAAVIFGGRQLGKSAILRAVERQFHSPERRQYVLFNDIKSLGDPEGNHPVSEIWRLLKAGLAGLKLIDAKVLDQALNVTHELLRVMERFPEMRVLLLLDEADNFLKADARENFYEVHQLKKLMDSSHRRFKVIFSGLHSVQRFCDVPNHPFAHLGVPINVGPLDPKAALALIREPLSVLGFTFGDDLDPIYRILAYTSYHPALIQHFCSQLIKSRKPGAPPFAISLKTVEDIYRDPEVRRVMRERFEWTVALDPRYEALVYAMILEQTADRDGYRKQMRAREILEYARQYWADGFVGVTPDEVKSLLDELVGLGVLVRLETGTYRLRNANVVRALGSESEIFDRMAELSKRSAPVEFDPRTLRASLDPGEGLWSPLTLSQEAAITKGPGGLGLVFASEALGLSNLPAALERLTTTVEEGVGGGLLVVPPDCLSVRSFQAFLDTRVQKQTSGRFVVLLPGAQFLAFAEPPAQTLAEIAALIRRRRSRQRSVHCVLAFDPVATVRWCLRPVNERRADEDRADVIANATVWGPEMVERCVLEYQMMSSKAVTQLVSQATGGWPWLICELVRRLRDTHGRSLDHVDPRREAAALANRLVSDRDDLAERFVQAVGLQAVPHGRTITRLVAEFEPVDAALITPKEIESPETDQETVTSAVEALVRLGILVTNPESTLSCNRTVREALRL